jgi:class 3 adenylate cyclase
VTGLDIATWLHGLGLQQYEQAFRDNAIDIAVLPELTAEDLKDLGVSLVGHRRKLLAAIAALRRKDSSQHPTTDKVLSVAERRQITVMFCDVVDSTVLSTRLDPEDLREVLGAFQKCVAEMVGRYDGFVARYMGDCVLAYFGYPQAHEDDAERAVRAGLAQIEAVRHLKTREQLQIRVGIATGLVVVGSLPGIRETQEWDIAGETPNLAARLQALAEPNTMVIDPRTRRLLGNMFEYRDLGGVSLKGFAEPVHSYEVLRPSVVESRFEALHPAQLTPLVGREEELALLRRIWARAKAGSGRMVLISAEPGIGKSRLIEEFRDSIEGEQHIRLRYFCSPYPRTAPSSRSSASSNGPPASRATTPLWRGSTSLRRYLRPMHPRKAMCRCWPSSSLCPSAIVTPRSTSRRGKRRKRHSRRYCGSSLVWRADNTS